MGAESRRNVPGIRAGLVQRRDWPRAISSRLAGISFSSWRGTSGTRLAIETTSVDRGRHRGRKLSPKRSSRGSGTKGGGGDSHLHAKVFDKALGAFQHRGRLGRTQGADAGIFQYVPQAGHKLGVGGDHRKVDSGFHRKFRQSGKIGGGNRHPLRQLGDARIAGGAVQLRQQRAFRQCPGQRMFAAARPHQQNLHRKPRTFSPPPCIIGP